MSTVAGLGLAGLILQARDATVTLPAADPAVRPVVYGWWNVPPRAEGGRPVLQRNRSVICTVRHADSSAFGGYVCAQYTIIQAGQRVVVLPTTYPDLIAPCSQDVGPGGRRIPCPVSRPAGVLV